MDTTYGLMAILRDARKGALLRMRSEIYFTTSFAGTTLELLYARRTGTYLARKASIGHAHPLAVIVKRQHADRVGISKTFKADAVGFARGGLGGVGWRERQDDERSGRDQVEENSSHQTSLTFVFVVPGLDPGIHVFT
jgi:hypothetical protein